MRAVWPGDAAVGGADLLAAARRRVAALPARDRASGRPIAGAGRRAAVPAAVEPVPSRGWAASGSARSARRSSPWPSPAALLLLARRRRPRPATVGSGRGRCIVRDQPSSSSTTPGSTRRPASRRCGCGGGSPGRTWRACCAGFVRCRLPLTLLVLRGRSAHCAISTTRPSPTTCAIPGKPTRARPMSLRYLADVPDRACPRRRAVDARRRRLPGAARAGRLRSASVLVRARLGGSGVHLDRRQRQPRAATVFRAGEPGAGAGRRLGAPSKAWRACCAARSARSRPALGLAAALVVVSMAVWRVNQFPKLVEQTAFDARYALGRIDRPDVPGALCRRPQVLRRWRRAARRRTLRARTEPHERDLRVRFHLRGICRTRIARARRASSGAAR